MKVKFTINSILTNSKNAILILNENTPWTEKNADEECERIQKRIFGCINLAADGLLAKKHPKTKNKNIIVRVECDGLPRHEMDDMFEYLNDYLFVKEDYRKDLKTNTFFKNIQIEAVYKNSN